VIAVESGGDAHAISPKGAMGLMQLMPATWRDMRGELGLGNDPFQPRNNILAGVGYLRSLYDRFGSPGYLAAYNAGPGRYLRHLDGSAPLPRETVVYVARVRRWMSVEPTAPSSAPVDWRRAVLFIETLSQDPGRPAATPLFVAPAGETRP
jgi:soluble lytic murein transglycosylase-like protein